MVVINKELERRFTIERGFSCVGGIRGFRYGDVGDIRGYGFFLSFFCFTGKVLFLVVLGWVGGFG